MAMLRILGALLVISPLLLNAAQGERTSGSSIYFTELGHLKHQAEQGDPRALFVLGNYYLQPPQDQPVEQNLAKASEYYFQAAIRGHANAQYNLAVLYYRGQGLPENKSLAYVWFTLAAENQDPTAKNIQRIAKQSLVDTQQYMSQQQQSKALTTWATKYRDVIQSKEYRSVQLPIIPF